MNFQEAVQSGFSNYANFRGRGLPIGILVVAIVPRPRRHSRRAVLDLLVNSDVLGGSPLATLFCWRRLFPISPSRCVGFTIPIQAGCWILLALIPLIGMVVLIAGGASRARNNRFGADPLQPALTRATASSRANR